MEGLNFNNILSEESEINGLFSDSLNEQQQEEQTKEEEKKEEEQASSEDIEKEEQTPITEVSVDDLFSKEPESVGNDNNNDGITPSEEDGSKSPNYYSSFAKALYEEGDIIPGVDEEFVKNANNAEGFKALIQEAVKAQLDEAQREYLVATNGNMSEEDIELASSLNTLKTVENISEDFIKSDSNEAVNLRRQIILTDFLNKGYSQEKARKMLDKSIKYGSEVEDAMESLEEVKSFFREKVEKIEEDKKLKAKQQEEQIAKNTEDFKNSILKDNYFGDIYVDNKTRELIIDNTLNQKYKSKDGRKINAIDKYIDDNGALEYQKNIAILFTLTDGFKNIDKLVNSKVNKEVKKGLKSLEKTLVNSSGFNDGNLAFVGNSGEGGINTGALPKGWHF